MTEKIKGEIRELLCNTVDIEINEQVNNDTNLGEIGLDSIRFLEFIVAIEEKYDIEVYDSDLMLSNFTTLEAVFETMDKYFHDDSDSTQKLYKCVITDCDGVLWHGIAGESGNDRAYIDTDTDELCKLLHNLRECGVLLAVCSKNERSNIEAMLDDTALTIDDFAIIETDTVDKVDSVSYILSEFGFTADSAVYIDDSNSELEYIKNTYPELTVIKADYGDSFIQSIADKFADLPLSDNIDRTAKFREQKEREKVHHGTSSPDEYNRILDTTVICGKAAIDDVPRMAELSHRANRFNLTGTRYTTDDIEQLLNDNSYSIYRLCAADKFGDMGLVAMAVIHGNVIESFVMSCRVFGRKFENKLLNEIKQNCNGEVIGLYHSTGKNSYCKDFYADCGVKYELR